MQKNSWLYSDSFLKRALAIYGYNLVGGLIIGVPVAIAVGIFTALFIGLSLQTAP